MASPVVDQSLFPHGSRLVFNRGRRLRSRSKNRAEESPLVCYLLIDFSGRRLLPNQYRRMIWNSHQYIVCITRIFTRMLRESKPVVQQFHFKKVQERETRFPFLKKPHHLLPPCHFKKLSLKKAVRTRIPCLRMVLSPGAVEPHENQQDLLSLTLRQRIPISMRRSSGLKKK